jgi:hypothetical protein
MNKHILVLAVAISLFSQVAKSQTGPVIPPSPNMATIQKFGDYPVSHSTGLVQIGMPLYTIQLKGYSFPISIDFHASGRRASTDFSPLGIGWSLNAASCYISREIHEYPDELHPHLDKSAADILAETTDNSSEQNTKLNTYDQLIKLDMNATEDQASSSSRYDSQYDIYSYSVNGISGKFIVTTGNSVKQLTQSNLTIQANSPNGPFDISDEKGIHYTFGTYGSSPEVNEKAIMNLPGGVYYPNVGWFLANIVTPAGETITFNYSTQETDNVHIRGRAQAYYDQTYGWLRYIIGPNGPMQGIDMQYYNSSLNGSKWQLRSSGTQYRVAILKGITFSGGSVAFNYNETSTIILTDCVIKNSQNTQIKKVTFAYSPLQNCIAGVSNNNSKVLSTLSFYGNTFSIPETYNFDYYHTATGDDCGFRTDGNVPYSDWWGYSNGTGARPPSLSDNNDLNYQDCPYCKNADEDSKKPGMLTKITYPTGGNTQFVYENNKYFYNNNPNTPALLGPGLRIKQVITDDGTGTNIVTKTYKYGAVTTGEETTGCGYLAYSPTAFDFISPSQQYFFWYGGNYDGSYNLIHYSSSPIQGLGEGYTQPISYSRVTEYTESSDPSKKGKIVYSYTLPDSYSLNTDLLKSFRMKTWTVGKFAGKFVYKYAGGTYKIIESSQTGYETLHVDTFKQIQVWRKYFLSGYSAETERYWALVWQWNEGFVPLIYQDDPILAGDEVPQWESHATYDDAGNAIARTDITYVNSYDPGTGFITRTQETIQTSNSDKLVTEYSNYSPAYPMEIRRYHLNPDGSNKRLVSSQAMTYAYGRPETTYNVELTSPLAASSFTPATYTTTLTKDSRYASVPQQLFSYDSGIHHNLQQQLTYGTSPVSYVWSYNGQYPIAKIENANYSTVQAALGGSAVVSPFRDQAAPSDAAVNSFLAPLRSISGAQVTTYTYIPLVGMTSMTDPKGETTYYQYDTFNRLQSIWDHNKNLVKSYCYNYMNQLTGCPVPAIPGQVYVKLSLVPIESPSTSSDGNGGTYYTYYYNVKLSYYSDIACTVPTTLPGGLTLELDGDPYFSPSGGIGGHLSPTVDTYSASPSSATSDIVGTVLKEIDYNYMDPYYNPATDVTTVTYTPSLTSGTYILL